MKSPQTNVHPGPWEEVSTADSIRTVRAADFSTFFQFVDVGFGTDDCEQIWRGQRSAEWEVVSGLARSGKRDFQHLANFARAVSRCSSVEYEINAKDPEKAHEQKLRLWSLGQHHGLATPLTDWTMYPFVALFFAFVEPEFDANGDRAVFGINWDSVQRINSVRTETLGIAPFRKSLDTRPFTEDFKKYLLENHNFIGYEHAVTDSTFSGAPLERLIRWEYERIKDKQLKIYRSPAHENRRQPRGFAYLCSGGRKVSRILA